MIHAHQQLNSLQNGLARIGTAVSHTSLPDTVAADRRWDAKPVLQRRGIFHTTSTPPSSPSDRPNTSSTRHSLVRAYPCPQKIAKPRRTTSATHDRQIPTKNESSVLARNVCHAQQMRLASKLANYFSLTKSGQVPDRAADASCTKRGDP